MITNSEFQFIISRVVENACDSLEEAKQNKNDDFYKGRKMAYYEILDTIKNELEAREQELKEFGLDFDIEKVFLID